VAKKGKGIGFCVINSAWVRNWRIWVDRGIPPGPINNKRIAETIMSYRMD
jgi:hypothetical protein